MTKPLSWAQQQRQAFILERLTDIGTLRRQDIMDTFRIGVATASHDIRTFISANPGAALYDLTAKAYTANRAVLKEPVR